MVTLNLRDCLGLNTPDRLCYEQNMNQANISLLPLWRSLGNYGDLPTGWNGPPSAADQARELAEKQKTETAAATAAREAKLKDYDTRFRTAVAGQEKLPDIYNRVEQKYSLQDKLTEANRQSELLQNTDKRETQANRGYNVNSNQLSRIIADRTAKLAPGAQQAVNQYQTGSLLANNQMGFETQQQIKDLQPFQVEAGMLGDEMARQFTGFTNDKQNELNMVMQNIANGQAVSLEQLRNANALAMEKIKYDNAKKDIGSQLISLSEGETLYDPSTRQPVYTQPKTYKSTSGGSGGSWS